MSRFTTGTTSRGLLKLAAVIGYLTLMMVSLFGSPSLRAQSSPTVTPVASNLTVSPSTLTFGFQITLPPDGVPSKPKNITLSVAKNQLQPVTIESIAVSDPVQFLVQPNSCSVIQPGISCSVPIIFQPSGLRRRTAVLMVTSNAGNDNGVQSISLLGFGQQGTLSLNPRSLSFPVAMVAATPTTSKSVTLTNRNAVKMTLGGISSSNPEVFQLTNECPTTLQPNAKCTVSVSFTADRNGGIFGRINIIDNSAGPNRVALSGSGRGGPTATRTSTPTRTATPSATKVPGPSPMRAFPVMH